MLKKILMLVILAVWTVSSSGCATTRTIVAPYPPLPLPARPVLPEISSQEFYAVEGGYCFDPSTAKKIFKRDKLRKQYELKLEAIIQSTH